VAKEYIAAGDVFQVVLAQRFTTPFALPALRTSTGRCAGQSLAFLYFLDLPGFAADRARRSRFWSGRATAR